MGETMRAVRVHEFGAPEALICEDVPRPEAGPGEVLIRVHAAGVNPVDCTTRRGDAARVLGFDPLHCIVGWDVSGVVAAVGPGVDGFKAGDEVYGMPRFPRIAGAYAEYVAAPAGDVTAKPRTIDHIRAAGVPLAGLTAWQALFDTAQLSAGQTVLIHAAAGGVGHIAVQLAKSRGATVIGTGSARNEAFLRDLGVDAFIDYTTTPIEDAAADVDVQLDSLGAMNRERCWSVMKRDGFLVSIKGPVPEDEAASHGVRAGGILVHPDAGELAEMAGLIDSGKLRIVVDAIYPLADAAEAHRHVEGGHARGKVVLAIAE